MRNLILCLASVLLTASTPTVIDTPQVMQYAEQRLPHTGILEKTKEGLVYLKVSDDYINALLPLLKNNAVKAPPYFGQGGIGAHVTLILPEEVDWSTHPQFPSWGTQIPFNISHFVSVVPEGQPPFPYTQKVNKLYLITLEAPALESLRLTAGLSPKILGRDFHITIGVEYAER
ncbi:MAG: hypothetical protein K2P51_02255 [Rhabdochlamydiaceae bacterium]|nr:hypothetical protein [Rhabdochlamydiaceae bacterium]